jgi:L-threonylcarbamoyladenylate synthase
LLILDGGPCHVGIESTIIDCTRGQPVLLRPGAITPEQVQAVCGLKVLSKSELFTHAAPEPKASGMLESHYAPRARVRIMGAIELRAALAALKNNAAMSVANATGVSPRDVAVWSSQLPEADGANCVWGTMPTDATVAAQQLFAALRDFDFQCVREIWIESPPETPAWEGVRDRLQRAAA